MGLFSRRPKESQEGPTSEVPTGPESGSDLPRLYAEAQQVGASDETVSVAGSPEHSRSPEGGAFVDRLRQLPNPDKMIEDLYRTEGGTVEVPDPDDPLVLEAMRQVSAQLQESGAKVILQEMGGRGTDKYFSIMELPPGYLIVASHKDETGTSGMSAELYGIQLPQVLPRTDGQPRWEQVDFTGSELSALDAGTASSGARERMARANILMSTNVDSADPAK